MREIKFRAWTDLNCFIENYCYLESNSHFFGEDLTNGPIVKILAVEQFNGLNDANGKKIYEGDIIKHDVWGILGAVEYGGGMYRCAKDDKDIFLNSCQLKTKCKIIGNIHEAQE